MLIFHRAKDLHNYISFLKQRDHQIGFVPTMGALHEGHLSLLAYAREENDVSICSIFVNPRQFNDPKDLQNYPRTFKSDVQLLTDNNCDILFYPSEQEIYPDYLSTHLDLPLNGLDQPMEGEYRPGHFKGMLEVVKRLLDIVNPHRMYMGQKDYQQYRLVQHMVKTLDLNVDVVRCPIVREENGLAMSSRNRLLSGHWKQKASAIHETLKWAKSEVLQKNPPAKVANEAITRLESAGLSPEYFYIIDGVSLTPVENTDQCPIIIACAAARAGDVRLIDNMIIKEED